MLLDRFSAMTIQSRVLHELLVGGNGDEEDPSQKNFLQLSTSIEHRQQTTDTTGKWANRAQMCPT
jgi:hypothetical protein